MEKAYRFCLKILVIFFLAGLAPWSAWAQSQLVGVVVDENSAPIPGVSILEKGTLSGTVTDLDGKFTLEVDAGATLVFSYIGYLTQEITVTEDRILDVQLFPAVTDLEGVVVTALGVEKNVKSLGYAVQEVDGERFKKAREPNLINSLTGQIAGLQVNNTTALFQDPQISLRGARPLIVIDGIPSTDNDYWKVNADDVESINVLKGATASALYGAIGRNGALMITTKRGGQGTQVEINSSTLFQPNYLVVPEVQTTYGNGDNGQYAYIDGSGRGTEGFGWIWGPRLNQPDPSTPSGFVEVPQYNSPRDPNTGELIPLPLISRGENNIRNFFQRGLISTNNINITSGTENGSFRISGSNVYQKGLVPNTELNNTSFSVSGGYKISDKLSTDASITYNRQYTDNFPETPYGPENYLYNLVLWTGVDVDVRDLRNYWVEGQEGFQQKHFNNTYYNNPYFQAYEYLRGYYKDNTFGQVKFDYQISPELTLTARTGLNNYALDRTDKEPKSYVKYGRVSRGNFYIYNSAQINMNTDLILNYSKRFGENWGLNANLGAANRFVRFRSESINTDGLAIPNFYNVANSEQPLSGSNSLTKEKINSAYFSADIDFMNAVFLTLTGRNDWVSTLPVANNSFFYPSVGLATTVSDFLTMPSFWDFAKVRMSWSQVADGRISSNPYSHIQAYSTGINWNGNPSLFFPGSLVNPTIRPETSDSYEIGLDNRFLGGRLGIDLTYFQIRDYNNLISVPVSLASGFSSRLENGAEFKRSGFELMFNALPIQTSELTWEVNLNFSTYKRILTESFDGTDRFGNLTVGERTDQLFSSSQFQRTPEGRLIIGNNGFPIRDPYQRSMGFSNPDFIFGVQNRVTYKGISLGFSFDGRAGGTIYSLTSEKMWWGGTHPGTVNQFRDDANEGQNTFVADGVVVTGGEVEYDDFGNILSDTRTYAENERPINYIAWNKTTLNADLTHYFDASFVKLRELSISYQLPQQLLQRTFLNTANVSLVGRNLMLWSNVENIDPDSGVDNLQTPSVRNIGFNINLGF
ncbi:SusC/RagA family TonB-linked outer membrane protein [Algoriphagus hitonicola]|uniref:TonB-linked outer membrane protein, SusC/RagA family n=1 Tax=Algoriphagus hitonicola TaxID=435880 RepID=A0A1I2XK84_9BACT|nr:SusC/RagA family TonB-linked outer membrane protein [Algoriphagus hitonicola]SFH13429.1 TonB-linked outer membrane protein, SusC/RagA family [Algoriphagus hitonicola]